MLGSFEGKIRVLEKFKKSVLLLLLLLGFEKFSIGIPLLFDCFNGWISFYSRWIWKNWINGVIYKFRASGRVVSSSD